VLQFKYLGTAVPDQYLTWRGGEVRGRLNSGNACYHLVQNLLFSHLFERNKKQNIQDYTFACGFAWESDPWSLTLGEEHRLKVLENRMLRRIFEPKRDEVTGGWKNPHNEKLLIYALHQA
jgi:hypothetical protein